MVNKNKKTSAAAVNSSLVSRPIRKCFPIFMLPTLAAFCIGFIWPFIQGMYLSLCDFTIPKDAEFIGFGNYAKAFADAGFRYSFLYTTLFAVVSIVAINVFAFTIAYLLTQNIRGANIFRTVFFMPNLIGGIVLGYIWSMIFDGILTNVMSSITICIFLTLTNSFKLFDQNLALTGGMPVEFTDAGTTINTTEMMALNIYKTFYTSANTRGLAQAKAVMFFILVAVLALAQLRFTRDKEVQQ